MEHKYKKFWGRKLLTGLLVLSIVSTGFYFPQKAQRAQAFLGVADTTVDVKAWYERLIDGIAMVMAKKMLDDTVKESIKWANSGFEDNPAYVTDFWQHYTDIADGVAGEFIEGSDLGFLCSPFQSSIRISLARQYYQPVEEQFSCTVSGIKGNYDAFKEDFTNGGWETWFSLTQNPTNNPYGAYIEASAELDSRLAAATDRESEQLSWADGFLSWSECKTWEVLDAGPDKKKGTNDDTRGACKERDTTKTPGAIIKSGLDEVLPSGVKKLVSVEHVEQLISAFAGGLLQRYVLGDKGLFAKASGKNKGKELIDIDKDNVPDGYDTDGDGHLDICVHGMNDQDKPASDDNCIKSAKALTSPYFIPICEETSTVVAAVEKLVDFMKRAPLGDEYAGTWGRRLSEAQEAVDNWNSSIGRYEIVEYDKAIYVSDKYNDYLEVRINSLIKNKDIKGGDWNKEVNDPGRLMDTTVKFLAYLKQFQTEVNKKCENPDAAAINNIVPPVITDDNNTGGGGGGNPNPTALSCSATPTNATTNITQVTWTLNNTSAGFTYDWNFEDDAHIITADQSHAVVTYGTVGTKSAQVNATSNTATTPSTFASCSNTVFVSDDF